MKDLDQVERIKIKLNLAKNTDSFFEVFGADSHKYRLDTPTGIKEIEDFEKKYNILLPDGYKVFLTRIGNGGNERNTVAGNSGAGPDYGIFKLGHKYHFIADPASGYLQKEPFFHSGITKKDWEKISEDMSENITDEEYDKEFERVYSGILAIGFSGCSGFTGIMLSGENAGRVVDIYDEIEYCPQFVKETNFLDWYENWLDSVIPGHLFKGRPYGTEEEHFARYANVKNVYKADMMPHWNIVALRYIKGFDSLTPEHMKILWENYHTETDKTVRLYILNLLAKFDYENTKTELDRLYRSNALEFLKILHLYAKERIPDWQHVIQKFQAETLNPEITEYIKYVIFNDCSGIRDISLRN